MLSYYDAVEGILTALAHASGGDMRRALLDARDLPGYAAKLYDLQHRHPEFARLATWQRLERRWGLVNRAADVEAIRSAQELGLVSCRFPAEHVLQLVLAIASMWSNTPAWGSDHAVRRRTVEEAVRRLVEP